MSFSEDDCTECQELVALEVPTRLCPYSAVDPHIEPIDAIAAFSSV